ncbi:amidohydrolase family protein [Pseudonocardia sp. GCM10023141]|uniref:amidohydrolase family protein n=1 Tax=Pseudonocardia sp. GCM10023141 TaxID=3252653 RepID=UPI00360F4C68
MPLRDDMQLISVDDHVVEPPDVWQKRLPQRYLDAAPRIVEEETESGGAPAHVWYYEGRRYPQIGLNAVAGKRPEEFGTEPLRYSDMLPGCYDPEARLIDMDLDGSHAALCFPSFPRFAGTNFLMGEDKDLSLLCVQAWNDFMIDEWCATAPDRLIPIVIMPLWDVDLCVAELERTAAKGARTVSFSENPAPLGLPSFHTTYWDRFFALAAEAQIPLSMHFGSSGRAPTTAPEAPFATQITLYGCNSMYAATDLMFSPVFHTHPELKVSLAEGGIGWVPYLLERADYVWERHRHYQNVNQEMKPSEIFARNIWGCFIEDEHGVRNRDVIGIDKIMWECDYPHSDSNWPNSRKKAADVLAGVPDDEAHKIVELNARELFRFPRTAP